MEHLHINGLRFRPIRGEKDAPDLVAIHLDRKERDQVDPLSTLESIPSLESMQRSLTHAMAKARGEDWLVAEVDERVVGYGRIASWPERDGTWIYLALGWITPDWRGQGIGTALLYQTEERIRYLVRREHPNEKIELAANASSTETEATALLLHEGYRVAYTLAEMSFEDTGIIKTQAMPGGFEVRPTSPDHTLLIARSVYEAYEDEYPGGRYDASGDPDDFAAQLSAPEQDSSLWQVAWYADEIAGQVLTIVERGRAEVFEVSVRPRYRRHGLARSLLSRTLLDLISRDIEVIRLHTRTDFQTRAIDLYTSLGFRVLKEFQRYRKPLALELTESAD
jgi:ribosomal protein S18 acetylase RimI-like enzyme